MNSDGNLFVIPPIEPCRQHGVSQQWNLIHCWSVMMLEGGFRP